ncbi:1-phosphatidylinositol phosphodiesterase-like, partial [Rhinichthys klamathensis goyatoka]|uniref:1-phosphatidylinositol phosphodiesterase-like n=1 Tax=Rhinichthys klamathensis goyatoka TaxID=3034132 RepID=UPI0024B4D66C
ILILFHRLDCVIFKSSQLEVFNDVAQLNLPKNYEIGWMKSLNDETLLSELTIPGTHDSLALHGGPAAECQAWSLNDQLKAGIRYFDLRVSALGLIIMHGPIYQHTSFPEAFDTIKTFLSEYNTETVLVRVKPVIYLFKATVQNLIGNMIENDISWILEKIPTIGQVRGKIVFVQKKAFELGISLTETDEDKDYIVTDVTRKKEKIKSHLTKARDEKERADKVFLIYSSGTGWPKLHVFKTPKNLAEAINPWLYDHLNNESKNNPKVCFGVIAMDFPGLDLIRKITELNN